MKHFCTCNMRLITFDYSQFAGTQEKLEQQMKELKSNNEALHSKLSQVQDQLDKAKVQHLEVS